MTGKFIVIEGPNKAGKTTQSKLLKKFLEKQGFSVLYVKYPQHKDIGNIIRKKLIVKSSNFSPQTIAISFAADMVVNQEEAIKPALKKYDYILADRYYHSTFTYQKLEGCKSEWIKELYRYIINPDLTFILDLPISQYKKRFQNNKDIYENEKFQKRLRREYLNLKEILNEDFVIINGSKSKEVIHKNIREIVVKL